jgi:hypothetical protein
VPVADVEDLLSGPARAAVAYTGPDGLESVPVVVRRDDGLHVGLDPDAIARTDAPERVVLVVDDGAYWFELRAAVWGGTVAVEGNDEGLVWFRLDPVRFVAWDYGRLREESAQ